MKVLYFQAQTWERDITPMLREIDLMCPKPQALEGGDGEGGLWQCMLDITKKDALFAYNNPEFRMFSPFVHVTEIEDDLYNPEYFVQWRWGRDPTVSRVNHRE